MQHLYRLKMFWKLTILLDLLNQSMRKLDRLEDYATFFRFITR